MIEFEQQPEEQVAGIWWIWGIAVAASLLILAIVYVSV
jgi:hypothetical protein